MIGWCLCFCCACIAFAQEGEQGPNEAILSILLDELPGFRSPEPSAKISLERDLWEHPDVQHDVWRLYGQLHGLNGERYGLSLTFIRAGLRPRDMTITKPESSWRGDDIYLAGFEWTDVAKRQVQSEQRLGRGALGLAGALSKAGGMHVYDWRLEGNHRAAAVHLGTAIGALDLKLGLEGPGLMAAEGDRQLRACQTSLLPANGLLSVGTQRVDLAGGLWLDRAWGHVSLASGQMRVSRFAFSLADGREIFLTVLQRRNGTAPPVASGRVFKAGDSMPLDNEDLTFEAIDHWANPRDKVEYPAAWHISIPRLDLNLRAVPLLTGQAGDLWPPHWSGPLILRPEGSNEQEMGEGYVYLSG